MRTKLQEASLLIVALAIACVAANATLAQKTAAKRLHNPATVKGFIGGESHDSYVIHAAKGRTLSVQISWRLEADNHAEFVVSESPNFGSPVAFGKESSGGKRWSGKVPKTGNYYIYVTAHPTAHYTLRVKVS